MSPEETLFLIKLLNYRKEFMEKFPSYQQGRKFIATREISQFLYSPSRKEQKILCSRKAYIPKSTNSCSRVLHPA